jgi:sec-independent protein translocase protein TatA
MTLLFIGTTELLLIAFVALLLFGGKKLPELMRGLGKGMKSFKQGMSESLDAEMPEKTPENAKSQAEDRET